MSFSNPIKSKYRIVSLERLVLDHTIFLRRLPVTVTGLPQGGGIDLGMFTLPPATSAIFASIITAQI